MLIVILVWAFMLFTAYVVIRLGVRHGVKDALIERDKHRDAAHAR